ncbi:MAG TPA: phosphohistidine phosphatase SixA [Thermodesulfovibrionales bacterium]|nr:phosphohistidine phosphatase SixA [Thermodesulfovibrionales bacterium]
MLLYLVQHAEAKRETEDPARGLTEKGSEDIRKVAAYLGKLDMRTIRIFHSGKTRALETARVLAEYLMPPKGITEADGLAPMDDPEVWQRRILQINEDVVLVGHLPHLEILASLLLGGKKEKGVIDFKMGGILCMKRSEGHWSVAWMMVPEVVA